MPDPGTLPTATSTLSLRAGIDSMAQARRMGLISSLVFKVLLAVMALACFAIASPQAYAWFEITTKGQPVTLVRATPTTARPTEWSEYQGASRADFPVRITSVRGETIATNLFLPEKAVATLLGGGTVAARVVWAHPRRFVLEGDPLPPVGGWWIGLGVLLGATFLYALRLK